MIIIFEGPDGSGKTTQAKAFAARLVASGRKVHLTSQPSSGTEIGKIIRRSLSGEAKLDKRAQALLFAADRIEQLRREIGPALSRGEIVVSDRWVHSSFVYQVLDGLRSSWVFRVNEEIPAADLAVYLRCDDAKLLAQRTRGRGTTEIYENEEFLQQCVARYDAVMSSLLPRHKRCIQLRADQNPDVITEKVFQYFSANWG
jgi:dTMP kinase